MTMHFQSQADQTDATNEPPPATAEPASSSWLRRLRLATRADADEIWLLFQAWAAQQGISYSKHKVLDRIDRAVRRDRAAIVVADKDGRAREVILLQAEASR